jgi:hypothetical protein
VVDANRTSLRRCLRALGIPADQIGVEDSFFRLGGDSISALQATSQARAVDATLSRSAGVNCFHVGVFGSIKLRRLSMVFGNL